MLHVEGDRWDAQPVNLFQEGQGEAHMAVDQSAIHRQLAHGVRQARLVTNDAVRDLREDQVQVLLGVACVTP